MKFIFAIPHFFDRIDNGRWWRLTESLMLARRDWKSSIRTVLYHKLQKYVKEIQLTFSLNCESTGSRFLHPVPKDHQLKLAGLRPALQV